MKKNEPTKEDGGCDFFFSSQTAISCSKIFFFFIYIFSVGVRRKKEDGGNGGSSAYRYLLLPPFNVCSKNLCDFEGKEQFCAVELIRRETHAQKSLFFIYFFFTESGAKETLAYSHMVANVLGLLLGPFFLIFC